jgi:hypothetical protein
MKKGKKPKIAHTSSSPKGSGDFHGVGIKQPVGKLRESHILDRNSPNSKKMKPPRSLA